MCGRQGSLATERGNLPLQAIDVEARIVGLLAQVVVAQAFVNTFDQPLQATYIFPLPDRAAVTEFRMEVGDRVVEGLLKERAEARADYERAIAEGRRASIAEEERPGVFTMRVGNLMPGERARVRLVMAGPLPVDQGEATFRFPLVVAPRFVPGVPLDGEPVGDGVAADTDAVPDASRISPPVLLPGFPNPVRLSISVEIDPAGLELGEVRSSLHTLVIEERDGPSGQVRVVRVEPGERVDRDFVLRMGIGSGSMETSLVAVPDRQGDQGTFVLTVLPPAAVAAEEARPCDVALVLDRSGSMAGWKIVAARRAVARIVDSLGQRDRFLLLAFDTVVESPACPPDGQSLQAGSDRNRFRAVEFLCPPDGQSLQAGSDRNRFRAVEFLARLEAHGGTWMAGPLVAALDHLDRAGSVGRERVLVLVTDGQVGNEDEILGLLAPRLGNVRVYAVGIDTAVNEGFLKRLASLGGGACALVESEDRLDAVLDRVRQRIGSPVVTDLALEPDGLRMVPESVSPRRLPALLGGAPLLICGRYQGRPEGALALSGQDAAGRSWRVVVPVTRAGSLAMRSVWARAHVRDLEDRYASAMGLEPELERRIVRTSLEFGVLSRFTAFVAVDTVTVNRDGCLHRVVQPVDVPAGWELPGPVVPVPEVRRRLMHRRVAVMAPGGAITASAASRAAPALQPEVLHGLEAPAPPAGASAAAPPLPGDDLAAYRRRARDLARVLEAAPEAELARRLGVAARALAALLADLASVDPDERDLEPLRQLAAELARRAGRVEAGPAALRRLRARALATLTRFAEPAARVS